MAQTALNWFLENIPNRFKNAFINNCSELIEIAKEMEEKQLKEGMMYSLDEDGHTGDWKLRFVNDYFNRMFDSEKEKFDQDESGYPVH